MLFTPSSPISSKRLLVIEFGTTTVEIFLQLIRIFVGTSHSTTGNAKVISFALFANAYSPMLSITVSSSNAIEVRLVFARRRP